MGAKGRDRLRKVAVRSRAEWRAWLRANHMARESIWLVTYKKRMGRLHLPYDDIVEEALCFGWIDSLRKALDEERTMLLVSPRRRGSAWSPLNKDRVARLITQGRMTAAGLKKVEEAKADGSWSVYDHLDTIPSDLAAALATNSRASSNFVKLPPSIKRGILAWIESAKREETRLRRIRTTVRLTAQGAESFRLPSERAKPSKAIS